LGLPWFTTLHPIPQNALHSLNCDQMPKMSPIFSMLIRSHKKLRCLLRSAAYFVVILVLLLLKNSSASHGTNPLSWAPFRSTSRCGKDQVPTACVKITCLPSQVDTATIFCRGAWLWILICPSCALLCFPITVKHGQTWSNYITQVPQPHAPHAHHAPHAP
jgi:hypothetical protein